MLCVSFRVHKRTDQKKHRKRVIYTENALVTVAVPVAPGVKTGILGPRKRHRSYALKWKLPEPDGSDPTSLGDPRVLKHKLQKQSVHLSLQRTLWEDARCTHISEWAGRGWTMQEEFMASRMLSYTSVVGVALQIRFETRRRT